MDNNQSWYNPSGNGVQVQPINDSKVLEKLDRLIDICNSQEETMEKLYQFFMNEKNVLSKDTSVPYNVLADTPVETPETETNEELKEDNLLTDSIPSVSDIEVPEVNLENPITDESSESEPNIEENTSVEQDNNIKGINDLLKSFEQEQTDIVPEPIAIDQPQEVPSTPVESVDSVQPLETVAPQEEVAVEPVPAVETVVPEAVTINQPQEVPSTPAESVDSIQTIDSLVPQMEASNAAVEPDYTIDNIIVKEAVATSSAQRNTIVSEADQQKLFSTIAQPQEMNMVSNVGLAKTLINNVNVGA